MSIADFYISNGIDPWDHRQFENWIVGTKLEFQQQTRRRRRSAPYTESSLNDYQICDIAEKEEWNKIEHTEDERDENEDVPRDRKLSFRKGKYEVEFFLDRRSVTSREIVNVNVNHTATPTITTTQRIRVNRSIVMKYVPNILEDPTNHNFDTGTRNVIGVIHTWKGSYGFVRTFHHTQYGQGGGWTHGYRKNEYFVHQSKLSSELLAQKNSYKFLGLTPVIFDTVPTDEKLDRAVNVQLWTGSYHGHPNSDPSCSSPLYVHNNNSNSVVTPSPGGGRKRRKLSRFSWTEDELLTDRDQAEKEIKRDQREERDRQEEVERFNESCCVIDETMVDYLLRGKLNDEYEAYAWIDDESWLIIDQEEAEEEMDQEEADEEERFNDDLLNNLVWGKLSDDYDEPSWMNDEDGLIIDREMAEEEIYHQEEADEEERVHEDLLDYLVRETLSDDYEEYSWINDEDQLIIDREDVEIEMNNQEKDDAEERVNEGLVAIPPNPVQTYTEFYHAWTKRHAKLSRFHSSTSGNDRQWAKYYAEESSRAAHHFYENPHATSVPFSLPPAPPPATTGPLPVTAAASSSSANKSNSAGSVTRYVKRNMERRELENDPLLKKLFPWSEQELLVDQEEIEDDMHREEMEEERRVDKDFINFITETFMYDSACPWSEEDLEFDAELFLDLIGLELTIAWWTKFTKNGRFGSRNIV